MKKTISILFILFITSIMLLGFLIPDKSISFSERRRLQAFPEFSVEDLLSGDYMESIESYLLDHMPFRDTFKSIKVGTETNVFGKSDINDMYLVDDHLIKIEYPYKQEMGLRFVEYISKIQEKYLNDNDVFVSIIPDKNYFGSDSSLKLDYDKLVSDVKKGNYSYIDLFNVLELDSYYKTDPHWKQENLEPILDILSEKMNFSLPNNFKEYEEISYEDFYGAYAGQSSINVNPENLTYLVHSTFDSVDVFNYETNEEIDVYNKLHLEGIDPYDVFLGGASPLIKITNNDSKSDKELIIFRDSFSSSLAPLLIGSYRTITLVDTRYVPYDYLGEYIDFSNQDVLFLYSTLVVNNSVMLR